MGFLPIFGVALSYFLLGHASFLIAASHGIVTPIIFLPEGVALAAGIIWGPRVSMGVFLGQLLLALSRGQTWMLALAIAAVNALEAIIGALLARHWGISPTRLTFASYGRLILLIFFILQPFSATFGTASLWMAVSLQSIQDATDAWLSWWIGNALAQSLLVPLLLGVLHVPWSKLRQDLLRCSLPAILLIPALELAFFSPIADQGTPAVLLLCAPLLLWIAGWGGIALASLATTLVVLAILILTGQGYGSFVHDSVVDVFNLNTFILGLALTTQAFSLLDSERKAREDRLLRSKHALRQQKDRLDDVIWGADVGTWDWTVRTGAVTYNARWAEMLGYSLQELAPLNIETWRGLTEPGDLLMASQLHQDCFRRESDSFECEIRMQHKEGHWVWVQDRGRVVEWGGDGQAVRMSGTHVDITRRKMVELKLKASEEKYRELSAQLEQRVAERTTELEASDALYRRLFNSTSDSILILDLDGHLINVNDEACRQYGYTREELLNMHISQIDTPEEAVHVPGRMQQIHQHAHAAFEAVHRDARGEIHHVDVRVSKIDYDGCEALFSFCRDITQEKADRERVEYLAFHDALTDLPNRRLAQDRLSIALAIGKRQQTQLGVLILDIHQLRHVNDLYGHEIGDLLLRQVGQRMQGSLRGADSVARLGGDEFLVIMSNLGQGCEMGYVTAPCDRLLAALAEPFDVDGWQIEITSSVGISLFPKDGETAEILIRNADIAGRESKQHGPQHYAFFEEDMTAKLMQHLVVRDGLRSAVADQSFELHYQPQIELSSGKMIGVEALLRWRRSDGQLIGPADFIQVAEESGLIVPIGRWVLQEACRQAVTWRTIFESPFVMAVNVSANQFKNHHFGQEVLSVLAETGLDPRGLELELTESVLIDGESSIEETLTLWKTRGIQLSIDDFGTGYSGLYYLKRLQVDKVKLDRCFVSHIQTQDVDRAIVQAIIQMARALNLKTIAEGVEDESLAKVLLKMGCDEAQGYYYAQPMPPHELEKWLTSRNFLTRAC